MKRKQPVTDAVLLDAIRERMLAEISKQHEANVINNMIGGSSDALPTTRGARGVGEYVHSATPSEDVDPALFDYLVDITKEDLPIDPETKKPRGWKKSVHRYRSPKGGAPSPKKGPSAPF